MLLDEHRFEEAVATLAGRDGRLAGIVREHGVPQFWSRPAGFPALVLFILEQQVSLASAKAAYQRVKSRTGVVTPGAILGSSDADLRSDGFSRQKSRYVRALATAIESGELDLSALPALDDREVRRRLMKLPGIGPWTADVYLLSCLRRPDIWPVGDRALQVGTAEVLGLSETPSSAELVGHGEPWRPHRSSAARLIWHGYLSRRNGA